MLSKPRELRIRTAASEDPGITFGQSAPALALERASDDFRSAAGDARLNDLVNEVDKLVRKTNRDLLAHPKTVANW